MFPDHRWNAAIEVGSTDETPLTRPGRGGIRVAGNDTTEPSSRASGRTVRTQAMAGVRRHKARRPLRWVADCGKAVPASAASSVYASANPFTPSIPKIVIAHANHDVARSRLALISSFGRAVVSQQRPWRVRRSHRSSLWALSSSRSPFSHACHRSRDPGIPADAVGEVFSLGTQLRVGKSEISRHADH